MASIYIVNVVRGGYYTDMRASYHRSELEATESFEACKAAVGEDPALVELVRLDTETLEAVTITGWEGTMDDLDDEEEVNG